MREAASLRQQRRMKQAVQFIHKDSADLLPLDGLKKLGSSKDTVSPRDRARLGSPARGPSPSRCAVPRGPPIAAFTESPPRPAAALCPAVALHPSPASVSVSQDSVVAVLARPRPSALPPPYMSALQQKRPCPAFLPPGRLSFALFAVRILIAWGLSLAARQPHRLLGRSYDPDRGDS